MPFVSARTVLFSYLSLAAFLHFSPWKALSFRKRATNPRIKVSNVHNNTQHIQMNRGGEFNLIFSYFGEFIAAFGFVFSHFIFFLSFTVAFLQFQNASQTKTATQVYQKSGRSVRKRWEICVPFRRFLFIALLQITCRLAANLC